MSFSALFEQLDARADVGQALDGAMVWLLAPVAMPDDQVT